MVEPRLAVTRWVKAHINKLVEEEMDLGTQVEQDDFKAAVAQFAIRFNIVQTELDLAIKDKQSQATKRFEVAKLQSTMVFGLDDESIAGIEATSGLVTGSGPSIALNPAAQKRKRDETGSGGPSKDAILLSETFERPTTILAQALVSVMTWAYDLSHFIRDATSFLQGLQIQLTSSNATTLRPTGLEPTRTVSSLPPLNVTSFDLVTS